MAGLAVQQERERRPVQSRKEPKVISLNSGVPQHVINTIEKYNAYRDRYGLPPKFALLQGLKASTTDGEADFNALDYVRRQMYGSAEQNGMHGETNRREWDRRTWRGLVSVGTFYDHLSPAFTDPAVEPLLARYIGVGRITGASGEASEKLYRKFMGTDDVEKVEIFEPAGDHKKHQRFILERTSDAPLNLDQYREQGGYNALDVVLEKSPEERSGWILKQVTDSGLVGWGGAHVKAGLKWSTIAGETKEKYNMGPDDKLQKIVVINADEGEQVAVGKDRAIMQKNPHALVEGTILTCLATGANVGIVYIRGDYHKSVQALRTAIEEARTEGYLRDPETGKGLDIDIFPYEGAGSYVCGNASSLLQSMNGIRPRSKRTMRTTLLGGGLNGWPTLVTNVETASMVPGICRITGEEFKKVATKIVGVSGTRRNGLIEVRRGSLTAGQLIDIYGRGVEGGFGAYQPGGVSTAFSGNLETVLDIDPLRAEGNSWGTAMMNVVNKDTNMPALCGDIVDFYKAERCHGCGNCYGTLPRDEVAVSKLRRGQGTPEDAEYIVFRQRVLEKGLSDEDRKIGLQDGFGHTENDKSECGLGAASLTAFASALKLDRKPFMKQ